MRRGCRKKLKTGLRKTREMAVGAVALVGVWSVLAPGMIVAWYKHNKRNTPDL